MDEVKGDVELNVSIQGTEEPKASPEEMTPADQPPAVGDEPSGATAVSTDQSPGATPKLFSQMSEDPMLKSVEQSFTVEDSSLITSGNFTYTEEEAAQLTAGEPEELSLPPLFPAFDLKNFEEFVDTERKCYRTTDPCEGIDLLMGVKGLAAAEPTTVGRVFKDTMARIPQHPAMRYMEGDQWSTITYSQYYDLVIAASKSFIKLGLEPFHGVSIIGYNHPRWLIADLAAMIVGGLPAGIYTTNLPEACQYVAHDCKANVIVVENQKQLDKILAVRDQLPHLKAIVQYTGKLSQEYENTYDWEQFMELGKDIEDSVVEAKLAAQKPNQCALLIYTSGTTGNPKGVMLSHDNLTWTTRCLMETFGETKFGEEHILSYLPLSHAAAQMSDIYLSIMVGGTVHFSQPDALKGGLVNYLKEAQPTIFFGVPRVYEKVMERMQDRLSRVTGIKNKISRWSMKKGLKGNLRRQNSAPLPRGFGIADKLFFKKLKELLGFQRLKLLVVGSAPIKREVHEFFMSVNMPLMELYGMSESSGPQTLNLITGGRWRMCSVGPRIKGVSLKIDKPDKDGNGEICYYGRHVFMGYLNNEAKTKEAIDEQGWLHSGDIGRIDDEGFLYITGRIKELLITSGGENVPPVLIENAIKSELPFLNNVMVIGDHQKYLTCMVTLLSEIDPETAEPLDELSPVCIQHLQAIGSKCTKVSEVLGTQDKAVFDAIERGITKANRKATSNAQTVKKWKLLEKDFSIPGGELGPTLKVRRIKVVEKYAKVIDEMYEETQ